MSIERWMNDKVLQKEVREEAYKAVDDQLEDFMRLTRIDTTDLQGVAALRMWFRGLSDQVAAVVGNCAVDWPSLFAEKTATLVGVKTLGTSSDLCWEDYETLQTRGQLQARMTEDLREALEAHLRRANDIFFNGIPEFAMDGMLTSARVLFTQVVQSVTNPPNRDWASKTAEEIIADVMTGIYTIKAASESRTKPDSFAISQQVWTDIAARFAVTGATESIASVLMARLEEEGINNLVILDILDSVAHPGGPGPVFIMANSNTSSFGWNPTYLLGTDDRVTRKVNFYPSRVRGFHVIDPFTYGVFYDI